MQDARELLGRAQALFDRARDHVRDTAVGDPIDTALLQVYDLAFSAAELTGKDIKDARALTEVCTQELLHRINDKVSPSRVHQGAVYTDRLVYTAWLPREGSCRPAPRRRE